MTGSRGRRSRWTEGAVAAMLAAAALGSMRVCYPFLWVCSTTAAGFMGRRCIRVPVAA